jgi:hypothetical protein
MDERDVLEELEAAGDQPVTGNLLQRALRKLAGVLTKAKAGAGEDDEEVEEEEDEEWEEDEEPEEDEEEEDEEEPEEDEEEEDEEEPDEDVETLLREIERERGRMGKRVPADEEDEEEEAGEEEEELPLAKGIRVSPDTEVLLTVLEAVGRYLDKAVGALDKKLSSQRRELRELRKAMVDVSRAATAIRGEPVPSPASAAAFLRGASEGELQDTLERAVVKGLLRPAEAFRLQQAFGTTQWTPDMQARLDDVLKQLE